MQEPGVGVQPALTTNTDTRKTALEYLHKRATEVVDGASIPVGGQIPGHKNVTGYILHMPGGNAGYPSFWVRDAAMMLGADLIEPSEILGWIRLIASVQADRHGVNLKHGLYVPPYSIPDHITLAGKPCWYPGAYDGEDQGNGSFGFLPPADDAFFYIQMVREYVRTTSPDVLKNVSLQTAWGQVDMLSSATKAYDSVAVEEKTGLVVCDANPGKGRVDWGFCDTVHKAGLCLMPSLLRWQAARDLSHLCRAGKRGKEAGRFEKDAARIAASILPTFLIGVTSDEALLISATEVGRKDDLWASAYAVWLGILPPKAERQVATHLLSVCLHSGAMKEGQVMAVPPTGEFGGYWEKCLARQGTYQNGAYWGTPSGWFIVALDRVDRVHGDAMLAEFTGHLERNRSKGAPWECFNPALNHYQNPLYCATVALPYVALISEENHRHR